MYFICIACLNGSERLHRNNNVQWTAGNGVRLFKFFINLSLLFLILIDSHCRAEGSILTSAKAWQCVLWLRIPHLLPFRQLLLL